MVALLPCCHNPIAERGDRFRFTKRLCLLQYLRRDPAREGNFLVHMTTTGRVFLTYFRHLIWWKSFGNSNQSRPQAAMYQRGPSVDQARTRNIFSPITASSDQED